MISPPSLDHCATSNSGSNDNNDDLDVIFDWAGGDDEHDRDNSDNDNDHGDHDLADAALASTTVGGCDGVKDDQQDNNWGPLPWIGGGSYDYLNYHDANNHLLVGDHNGVGDAFFGFVRTNYMESIRTWTCSGSGGGGGAIHAPENFFSAAVSLQQPMMPTSTSGDAASLSSRMAPMATDDSEACDEDDFLLEKNREVDCDSDGSPPGMVRSASDSLSSEETTDDDDTMSNDSSCEDDSSASDDNASTSTASTTSKPTRGVTFNEQVRVLPIPPIEHYTLEQRYKMYANRFELRENKLRNKREYEFDNYDWRNATEEPNMAICPMSGELLHPAHL